MKKVEKVAKVLDKERNLCIKKRILTPNCDLNMLRKARAVRRHLRRTFCAGLTHSNACSSLRRGHQILPLRPIQTRALTGNGTDQTSAARFLKIRDVLTVHSDKNITKLIPRWPAASHRGIEASLHEHAARGCRTSAFEAALSKNVKPSRTFFPVPVHCEF